MVQMKLKAINYLGPLDTIEDISNATIDLLVRLNDPYCEKDPDFYYVVEVATPSNLSHLMEKWELTYLPPMAPFIIVQKLTKEIINEAIKAFVEEQDDAYWLKVYHLASIFTIDELNAAIERQNKETEADD
jgi:hypothetical protein